MKGDAAARAGGLLLLVAVMIAMIGLAMPMLFASEPVTEQYNFLQLCAFWASNDYKGTVVIDGQGVEISMVEPCKKALGLKAFPTGPYNWEDCLELCPAYESKGE